jgi:hypothetical protein
MEVGRLSLISAQLRVIKVAIARYSNDLLVTGQGGFIVKAVAILIKYIKCSTDTQSGSTPSLSVSIRLNLPRRPGSKVLT